MSTSTVRDVAHIKPITFGTDARQVALGAYDHLIATLEKLEPADWDAPTECVPWTVADMVGHLLGAARAGASLREMIRQQVWALRHKGEFDGNDLDAMNALHVRMHADLSPAQRVEALRAAGPAAVDGRMSFPRPLRLVRVPLSQSGSTAEGMPRWLQMGHLMEVIYTRDVFLHRIDIARATGCTLDMDPGIEGRIIDDIVVEWAGRHRQPLELTLTGDVGGSYRQGSGGQLIEMDAVEFCRVVSGRAPGQGLLATPVLF